MPQFSDMNTGRLLFALWTTNVILLLAVIEALTTGFA
jgi:hypothetical protein